MSILCMTGWQQPHDALAAIAPDATHFDYASYDNVETMFSELPKDPQLVIGWSLGGQLLVRAIAGGHIKPETLILLGAPFQWIADKHFEHGAPRFAAEDVQASYGTNAAVMLGGFHTLIAHGDSKEKSIIQELNATMKVWVNGAYWLDQLATATCHGFDFSKFPPAIIVHGMQDKVITPKSAEVYHMHLPKSELILWPDCAHAPHLHNPDALRTALEAYV